MRFIEFLTEQMPMAGARRSRVARQETGQEDVRAFMQELPDLLQNMSLGELRALDRALMQAGKGKFRPRQPTAQTTTGQAMSPAGAHGGRTAPRQVQR